MFCWFGKQNSVEFHHSQRLRFVFYMIHRMRNLCMLLTVVDQTKSSTHNIMPVKFHSNNVIFIFIHLYNLCAFFFLKKKLIFKTHKIIFTQSSDSLDIFYFRIKLLCSKSNILMSNSFWSSC